MFRENEASRIGDVLACKQAGDTKGLLDAAVRAWLEPPERDDDSVDAEIWQAIVEADALPQAVATGQHLVREHKLLRPGTYVRIIEHAPASQLLELAALVLDAGWPAQPYLGAIFASAIDAKLEDGLWDFMRAHRAALRSRSDRWTLEGFVLTTTRIGDRHDLGQWFAERPAERIPAWTIAAFVGAAFQQHPALAELRFDFLVECARVAEQLGTADGTSHYYVAIRQMELLRGQKLDEFRAALREHREVLTAARSVARLSHPVVIYANSLRRTHLVGTKDIEYEQPSGPPLVAAAQGIPARPLHWRLGITVRELDESFSAALPIFETFDEMLSIERGDKKARELYRKMSRCRPSKLPWIQPAWTALVRSRISFWRRMLLEYF